MLNRFLRSRFANCQGSAFVKASRTPQLALAYKTMATGATKLDGEGVCQELKSNFLLAGQDTSKDQVTHLIVLNWVLPKCLLSLWDKAAVRICADGGANRLYDEVPIMLPQQPADEVRAKFIPDVIHGDLDSLQPHVREFYTSRGVRIVQSQDQDSTDLTKCVMYLAEHYAVTLNPAACQAPTGLLSSTTETERAGSEVQQNHNKASEKIVLALGALGGRLDHTLSNLNTLHIFRHLNLVLLGEGNIVRLVRAGRCVIKPLREREGPLCGLVPMNGAATVTFTGLRWTLENDIMEWGGLISTSNIIDQDEIHIQTSKDLVWTAQLQD